MPALMNPPAGGEWTEEAIQAKKVQMIFNEFDKNKDGGLSKKEMASLVVAVNPRVRFSDEQINAILSEVFRTYGEFIQPGKGLSLSGLKRTYDDGAGDVDRDFDALGLELDFNSMVPDFGPSKTSRLKELTINVPETEMVGQGPGGYDGHITHESTLKLMEDLQLLLKRHRQRRGLKWGREVPPEGDESEPLSPTSTVSESELPNPRELEDALAELRSRADQGSHDEAFDAHMAMGKALADNNRHKEAVISFTKAVQLAPHDVRAHFRVGNSLHALGNLAEARNAFEAGLREGRKSTSGAALGLLPQVHVNLGITLEEQGLLMAACDHYREAAILNPKHSRALKLLGSAQLGVGDLKSAKEALEPALFLNPEYADARCDLGATLYQLHEVERAKAEFERTLQLQPSHPDALYNYGNLMRDEGDFRTAEALYSKVLAVNPKHWHARLNRAVARLGQGRGEDAQEDMKMAFKTTERVELYDAVRFLKRLAKKNKNLQDVLQGVPDGDPAMTPKGSEAPSTPKTVVSPGLDFQAATGKTTLPIDLALALEIRAFQKATHLDRCQLANLRRELVEENLPKDRLGQRVANDKTVRKSGLEAVMRRLLTFLPPETFAASMRQINERILVHLDTSGRGLVDLALVLALCAPLCGIGTLDERQRVAFDALVWRADRTGGQILKSDAQEYLALFRKALFRGPLDADKTTPPATPRSPDAWVSIREFKEMVADHYTGLGVLDVLQKLERSDRVRHSKHCASCMHRVIGLRYKEMGSGFHLCSLCYREFRVPVAHVKPGRVFIFKEFEADPLPFAEKVFGGGGSNGSQKVV